MMATPIALAHIRIRVQSPMFTMSATAPIVQKLVRFMIAPRTSPSAKVAQTTVLCTAAMSISGMAVWPASAGPVAGGVGKAGRGEALATDPAGIAAAAGAARGVGLVAGNGQRE